MRSALLRILRATSGATVIEYAMIAVLISIAAFGLQQNIGSSVSGFFLCLANAFNGETCP